MNNYVSFYYFPGEVNYYAGEIENIKPVDPNDVNLNMRRRILEYGYYDIRTSKNTKFYIDTTDLSEFINRHPQISKLYKLTNRSNTIKTILNGN